MIRWKQPPGHLGELIKQIPYEPKKEDIIDRSVDFTDIMFYILSCIWVLAKEIYQIKNGIRMDNHE